MEGSTNGGSSESGADSGQLVRKAALRLNGLLKKYKFEACEMILSSSDYPVDTPLTDTGINALGLACCNPNLEDAANIDKMIKMIISKEPDLNYKDNFGRTALHHAAKTCNVIAITILLQVGENSHGRININAVTHGGETPFMLAADVGS